MTEINKVLESIKKGFIASPALRNLYGINNYDPEADKVEIFNKKFPTATLEAQFCYVVAVVVASLYNMFAWLKEDINYTVENERYGYLGWYEKMAKMFRFGKGICNNYEASGSSFSESALYSEDLTEEKLDKLQVIKHAFALENPAGSCVIIKVATQKGENMEPITDKQEATFKNYINRIKPAGIPIQVINQPAEKLVVGLIIWIDPLIIDPIGQKIIGGEKIVETAITDYLKGLEFNGEFIAMKMVDAIQLVEGVKVVSFRYAEAKTMSRTIPIEIDERYTPESGYMRIEDFTECEIKYIVEGYEVI